MQRFQIPSGSARLPVDFGSSSEITNLGPGTLSYADSESEAADATVAAGSSVTLSETRYLWADANLTVRVVSLVAGDLTERVEAVEAANTSQGSSLATHGGRLDTLESSSASHAADITVLRSSPVNVKNYPGTVMDGSTDDTAGFNAAGAAGTGIYVPLGTARLGDWAPPNGMSVEGAGNATVLKAKTAAVYAVQVVEKQYGRIANLTIDGNAKASHGLLIKGGAVSASQHHLLDHVTLQNCNRGLDVDAGTVNQADKNTYDHCAFHTNTIGARIASANAQEQLFINPSFAANLTNIDISAGTLNILGGQMQVDVGASKGINISGANVQWISLDGFIFEGPDIDIDGSSFWPSVMLLRNCTLQGLTNTILCTANNALLLAEGCDFNNVAPVFNGTDQTFFELLSISGSLAPNSAGSTQFRHMKTGINGIDFNGAYIRAKAVVAGFASMYAQRVSTAQEHVLRVETEANALLAGIGPLGQFEMTEQVVATSPPADRAWIYARDNGGGKTQVVIKWSDGTTTTLGTQP